MKLSIFKSAAIVALIIPASGLFYSCGNSNEFKVSGQIAYADGKTLILERGFNGRWIALDSTQTKDNGNFSISFEAPKFPEVYRLRMDQKFVYFPIDSLEHITINSTFDEFDRDFTVAGSDAAVIMMNFEKEVAELNMSDSVTVKNFKRKVFNECIKDRQADVLSYHVLNKTIDGEYLFDPTDAFDIKIYAAVATAFKYFRPNDPRTALLEMVAVEGRKKINSNLGRQQVVHAQEISSIDIELKDVNGNNSKLSDLLVQGKPTVVIFSLLTDEKSPSQNREIAKIYRANEGRINIYQVCLDYDQLAWKNAAINLPWTVVYDPKGEASEYVVKYNVRTLPAAYIYNAKGELVDQATSFSDLSSKLSRL